MNSFKDLKEDLNILTEVLFIYFSDFLIDDDGFLLDDHFNKNIDIEKYYRSVYFIEDVSVGEVNSRNKKLYNKFLSVLNVKLVRRSKRGVRKRLVSEWDISYGDIMRWCLISKSNDKLYYRDIKSESDIVEWLDGLISECKIRRRDKNLNEILKSASRSKKIKS